MEGSFLLLEESLTVVCSVPLLRAVLKKASDVAFNHWKVPVRWRGRERRRQESPLSGAPQSDPHSFTVGVTGRPSGVAGIEGDLGPREGLCREDRKCCEDKDKDKQAERRGEILGGPSPPHPRFMAEPPL